MPKAPPRRPAAKSKQPPAPAAPAASVAKNVRPAVVGASLAAALGLTAGLLAWASPSPLTPDAVGRLFAVGQAPADDATFDTTFDTTFDAIYQTARPIAAGRWRHIYVHQSKTAGGDAATLAADAAARGVAGPADHFVVGNGLGAGDGEIQFTPRWDEQRPAAPPAAGAAVDSACVSICLVGDLDRARPTEAQLRRLDGLIASLRARLAIPAENVHALRGETSAAGAGRFLPPLK